MTKQELTFEALPVEVRNSALTTKQMGVLNVLYRMSTMETSKANPDGSFFASQAKLTEETGYSNNTIIDVRSNFDECGFITTQKGTWEGRMATTYILHKDVIMDWAIAHPRIGAVKQRRTKKGAVISAVNKCTDAVNKCTDEETQTLRDEVKQLREVVTLQNQRISALEEVINKMCNGAVIGAVNDNSLGAVIGAVTDKCTTESDIEKESTNHSVTSSNTIESNDYRADAGKTDEGDKAIFNKIEGNDPDEVEQSQPAKADKESANDEKINNPNDGEVNNSQATANKASGSVATPQMIQTTTNEEKTRQNANVGANQMSGNIHLNAEERINQLDALQLWKMNTPNVNPIELATELGKILTNGVTYQSNAYNRAEKVGCYLALYANDLDTLNQIETALTSGHIKKYGTSTINLDDAFAIQRNYLSNPQSLENSPEAHQSHADQSDEETITNEEKTRENAPDKATEAIKAHKTIDALLTKIVNINAGYVTGDREKEEKATKLMNKVAEVCGEIEIAEHLNWCEVNIPEILEKHGKVLGTNVNVYLTAISKVITNRRKELHAA